VHLKKVKCCDRRTTCPLDQAVRRVGSDCDAVARVTHLCVVREQAIVSRAGALQEVSAYLRARHPGKSPATDGVDEGEGFECGPKRYLIEKPDF
jgi:hypothetical protein